MALLSLENAIANRDMNPKIIFNIILMYVAGIEIFSKLLTFLTLIPANF